MKTKKWGKGFCLPREEITQRKEGKKRRKDSGGVDGGGAKKRKNCLGQKGKEKKGKGKRMGREKSGPNSSTWVLFFFSSFFQIQNS